MEEKDYKISQESAQTQIDLLLSSSAVEMEDISNEALKNALISSVNVLRRSMRKGFLEIVLNDSGDIVTTQHLQRLSGKKLEYREVDGQAKIITGKVSDDNSYERAYALLGCLSGVGVEGIKKLKGIDLSIAECLSAVFLGI